MSVIASNSVNFVPIRQLLKNFTDTTTSKGLEEEQFEKKVLDEILDVAEFSPSRMAQSNPISSEKLLINGGHNLEKSGVFSPEKDFELERNQFEAQSVVQNADSVRSFIVESTGKAMLQQANQSKQKALFLI